ncbi:MAG: hypothetical protein ABIU63_17670 [Chitinophagaceae bacterium]
MKKWMLIALLPILLLACKGKKKLVTDDEGVTTADFIEFFETVKTPFKVADSTFEKQKTDTVAISYKTFTELVPDSLLHAVFSKSAQPKLYPLGKIIEKDKETYLLVKAVTHSQKAAFVLVFDKDKKFITGMPLMVPDDNGATQQTAIMDSRYTITTNRQYKTSDGRLMYKKAVYAYIASTTSFVLILTESNEAETKRELFNPIDTLPRKNKLSGDYLRNKFNLVSIRDSKKPNELLFFVHFESNKDCKGELKGVAKITAPGKALYRKAGDQCELSFVFSGNKVTIKEDGCGSHRDIQCFFEGGFTRKPPPKTVKPVKKIKK